MYKLVAGPVVDGEPRDPDVLETFEYYEDAVAFARSDVEQTYLATPPGYIGKLIDELEQTGYLVHDGVDADLRPETRYYEIQ